jgi:hypothetical protein
LQSAYLSESRIERARRSRRFATDLDTRTSDLWRYGLHPDLGLTDLGALTVSMAKGIHLLTRSFPADVFSWLVLSQGDELRVAQVVVGGFQPLALGSTIS